MEPTTQEKPIAVVGATVITVSGAVHEPGTVVFEDGRITEVGDEGAVTVPGDAERIDARGMTLLPGLVDAHTHLGVFGEDKGQDGGDGNECSDPVTPELRACDSLDPDAIAFPDVLAAGITTVMTSPGSANIIGGTCMAIRTRGRTVAELTRRDPVGMKMALGFNPKSVYGAQGPKRPGTRMANAAVLRNALVAARNYGAKKVHHAEKADAMAAKPEDEREPLPPFEVDLKHEALLPVLDGALTARCHAHRADDILTAVRIADEFDLDLTIEHATEAYKVAPELADAGIPCIVGPHFFLMRYKSEIIGINPANAAILADAGVPVCIQTDATWGIQWLANNAALCVRHGLSEDQAIRAITLNPARVLGLEDEIGSIEVGKRADLLLTDGDPLDIRTPVAGVWLDGVKA
jgi:imidazolonepropionase-like amidohydrolase